MRALRPTLCGSATTWWDMKHARLLLLCVPFLPVEASAVAQCSTARFRAADTFTSDRFGASVDLDGERLVVGAPDDDDLGEGSGSAYVFVRTPTGWMEEGKLVPSDGEAGDDFGRAVAIDGTRAVVGAPFHSHPQPQGGAVYVFELQSGAWTQTAKLDAIGLDFVAWLGTSVDIDGSIIAAGAPYDSTVGSITGAVHVFEESGGVWTQTAKLVSSDAYQIDILGMDVALSGTRLLAGAPWHAQPVLYAGAAYVFERGPNGWVERAKLTASPVQGLSEFGRALALDGDRAIVTASYLDDPLEDTGAAYVFERQGGSWSQTATLVAGDPGFNMHFGWSVALSGDGALVGAIRPPPSQREPGAGYWFRYDGVEWSQEARLFTLDGEWLGYSAALDGENAALGEVARGRVTTYALPAFVDAFCPCANAGPCANPDPSGGCAHSEARGGALGACGSASVAADDLVLGASFLPQSSIALLFAGDQRANGGIGLPFGDGLLCVAGAIRRFDTLDASGAGSAQWGPGLGALGGWSPGDVRDFQVWFRDPSGPCGSGFNLTNAVELTLAP